MMCLLPDKYEWKRVPLVGGEGADEWGTPQCGTSSTPWDNCSGEEAVRGTLPRSKYWDPSPELIKETESCMVYKMSGERNFARLKRYLTCSKCYKGGAKGTLSWKPHNRVCFKCTRGFSGTAYQKGEELEKKMIRGTRDTYRKWKKKMKMSSYESICSEWIYLFQMDLFI